MNINVLTLLSGQTPTIGFLSLLPTPLLLIIDKACEWFMNHWINDWSQLNGAFLDCGFTQKNYLKQQ